MRKEYLEALEILKNMLIGNGCNNSINDYVDNLILPINQALQRLEAIDNANPSEALGLVKRTCEIYVDSLKQRDLIGYDIIEKQINEALDTIKQALVKSQEQEKVLEIIFENNVDIFSLKKCIELDLPLTDEQRLHKYNHDYMMIGMKQLTQEEFELLKRCLI